MVVVHEEYVGTATEVGINNKWWKVEDKDLHQHVFPLVARIDNGLGYRHTQNLKFARLYHNKEMLGFVSGMYARPSGVDSFQNRVTLNVVKSCIDTATSKIAKSKPRPLFITTRGSYYDQKKAKKLTQYVDGLFDAAEVYEVSKRVFVDSCVFGTGALKIYVENEVIKCERAFIDELLVDDAEGVYGEPRQMHQRKYVFRDKLVDLFPEHEQAILGSTSGLKNDMPALSVADQVVVVESWHLPSGPEAGDGKHTICVDNCTLFAEEYKKDYFPFVFMQWSPSLIGFWGTGLAEELVGIQFEINKLLKNIQMAMHLMAVPRVFIEKSSQINTAHISNEIGGIVKYTGTPPTFGTFPVMPAEVYQHLENLYKKAYEITGISLLSASSKKPGGLDSAVALREYQEIETERFVITGQRYEKFFIDTAKIMIDISRDLYSGNTKLKVKGKSRKFIESIKWKEVDLDDDKFTMQAFPTNMLPREPAGRLQTVQEYIAAGFVPKEWALELLDIPDVDGFVSLQVAALDDVMTIIEKIIEEEEYTPPDQYMNLDLAQKMAHTMYLYCKHMDDVSDHSKELIRQFIDECMELINPPAPPMDPNAMPAGPPGAPPGAPGPNGGPVAPGAMPQPSNLVPMQGAPLPPQQ